MNKSVLALIVIGSLSSPLAAQPAATVAIDVFLEQRVAEELAADGTILSRLGVALDVEAVGDKLIVSLVDPATRRAVASTKIDAVPDDRDAAVAAVTQVVANLAAQLDHSAPAMATAAAVKTVLREERADRAARELAEHKYRQEAISFGDEIAVHSTGKTTTVSRTLVAYRGEERRRLAGRDIYLTLGRKDLAAAYSRRVAYGWIGILGGSTMTLVGGYLLVDGLIPDCDVFDPDYDQCDAESAASRATQRTYGTILGIGGLVGMLVGAYYYYNRHPIDESEIYDLAADHNARLRQKYGLPVSERRRADITGPSLVVAPYALGDGAGLSVSGRF